MFMLLWKYWLVLYVLYVNWLIDWIIDIHLSLFHWFELWCQQVMPFTFYLIFAGNSEFPVGCARLHSDRQKPVRDDYWRHHSGSTEARDQVQEFPRTRSGRILLVASSQVLEKQGYVMWKSVLYYSLLHSSNATMLCCSLSQFVKIITT